ncbi:MAG TPA: hypothetical protein VG738_22165 [Chitinophagaceae bacterium]|nr:hypothetical protein [Chitinophagaceae bacterium]
MSKGIIRLLYRKIIDASAVKAWEKCAFNDSYTEFLMQAQLYNKEKKYTTFSEILANVPGAEKLHFLVSASVTGYIKQFNGFIPDIINTAGKTFLPFKQCRLEIIQSDITNAAKHRIAINIITEPLLWLDTIGNMLLISTETGKAGTQEEVLTEIITSQSQLNIHSFKQTENLWYHNQTEKYF